MPLPSIDQLRAWSRNAACTAASRRAEITGAVLLGQRCGSAGIRAQLPQVPGCLTAGKGDDLYPPGSHCLSGRGDDARPFSETA